jgi:hypothetical protein
MKIRNFTQILSLVVIGTLFTFSGLAQITWQVQSDYFGERNAIAQPRTIRGMALSADGTSVYTGLIQSPNTGSTSLRKVKATVLAMAGTDHVIFGNGMPGGTGTFGQVGGQPVYAGGATGTFEGWRDVDNSPEGIDTDDRGYVYVALQSGISGANRVDIFLSDLSAQVGSISVPAPTGVHIYKSAGIYYAYIVSSNGLQRWDVSIPGAPVLDVAYTPGVFGARSVTVDNDGTVFTVGNGANQVTRISSSGIITHTATVTNGAGVAIFRNKIYIIKRQSPTQPIVVLNKSDLTSGGPDLVVPALGASRGDLSQFTSIDISSTGRLYISEENYAGATSGSNSGALTSYTPPVTSFNPTPGTLTGRIYFDRVLISSSLILPVHNLTQGTDYLTIQEAVNTANANDVIECEPWTFNERVVINKALTIQGTNKSTCIVDGSGLAGVGSGFYINNGVKNVTIKNFTIKNFAGNGPNSYAGIYASGGNDNLTIQNNIVKDNLGGSGIYANGPVNGVITDILIDGNTVSGHDNSKGAARGIVIWNGLKQNITITNNEVFNNNCCGIELQDGTATGVIMSNNNVHDNGDNGLGLVGLQGPGANLISSNNLLNNGRFGIEVKNPNGSGAVSGAGSIVVENNTVARSIPIGSELRDIAGIAVFRRGVLAGNVDVPIGTVVRNNNVSGYVQPSNSEGFGIVAEGINHSISGNTLNGNDVGIQRQAGYTDNLPLPLSTTYPGDGDQRDKPDTYFGRGNSPVSCGINLSGNIFSSNGINTRDVGNAASTGVVTNTNTGKSYCSIQSAINDASTLNGHELTVTAGIFSESIDVNKELIIRGANSGISCTGTRGFETTINGPGGSGIATITVNANNVTIDGFAITNSTGSFGIRVNSKSGVSIQNNVISHIADGSVVSGATAGVYFEGATPASNINVLNILKNCISSVRGGTNGSGQGILIGSSNSNAVLTNLKIEENIISNITTLTYDYNTGGRGAYGIQLNIRGNLGGHVAAASIKYNNIFNLEGVWAHAIGLEGNTPNATIMNNNIHDIIDHKSPSDPDAVGVRIEDNTGANSVHINSNSLTNTWFAISNKTAANIDGKCNWYGSSDMSVVSSKIDGNVTYTPYLTNGGNSAVVGFEPTGSCNAPTATGLDFDGTNDYVSIGNILNTNESYTKEAWIFARSSGGNNIISSEDAPFWLLNGHLSASNDFVPSYVGHIISDPADFPLNTWVHVAVTYNAATSTMVLYKNGIEVASTSSAQGHDAGNILIGSYTSPGYTFNGKMDEVRIWNRALNSCEINNSMNCEGLPGSDGLIALYHLNQGYVNANNSSETTATDASGNGNHGTLQNFALVGSQSNWSTGIVSESCTPYQSPTKDQCPGNLSANTAAGTCSATLSYTSTFTGSNINSITYVFTGATTGNGSGTGSPASFNKGVTHVVVTASNGCENASCEFDVTISDTENPGITCPVVGNANRSPNSNVCTYTVAGTEFDATGTDNCGAPSMTYSLSEATSGTGTSLAGVALNKGVTTVTWTSTDAANNSVTCQFTVTVKDDPNAAQAYTLLAQDEIHMHKNNVYGNIGVWGAGKEAKIHESSIVTGFGKAPSFDIDGTSSVATQIPGQAPLPGAFTYNPGPDPSSDINVPDNYTGTGGVYHLVGNSFRKITVGKNSTAIFDYSGPGVINIKELIIKDADNGKTTNLQFSGNSTLAIRKTLDIGKRNHINQTGNFAVKMFVEENDVKVGESSKVRASIDVRFKNLLPEDAKETNHTIMVGQFIAKKVDSKKFIDWYGVCENQPAPTPPVAFAEETSEQTIYEKFDVKVFPNPTNNEFRFTISSSSQESINIRIMDVSGRTVINMVSPKENLIRVQNSLGAGTYFAEIRQGEEKKVLKVVKIQ